METGMESSEQESLGTRAEVEDLDTCKRRIKAAVPADKVREELDKSYRNLAMTVQLPGFRRGRVPRKLLEARFGEDLEKELKESLVNLSFLEVVKEKELQVVGSPKFDNIQFSKDADLTYDVELEVKPVVELGKYKGLEMTRETIPVKEEEIEEQLRTLQRNRGYLTPVELVSAGPDDVYQGRYVLLRDGVRVKSSDYLRFTPSAKKLDAFHVEDLPDRVHAWDKGAGAPLRIEVKVPPDFADEVLRGVDLTLEFALDEVRRMEYPAVDDDFARELGKSSLEELRGEVKESLESRNLRREAQKIEEKILEQVQNSTKVEVPEGLLESQKRRWRSRREYELLTEQGLKPEEVQQALDKEGEAATEDLRRELKAFFILDAIADKEKIFASEEEVDERLELLATYYGISSGRLREEMRNTGRMEDLRSSLRHERVREFLRKKARILGTEGAPEPAAEDVAETTPSEKALTEADAGSSAGAEKTGGDQVAGGEVDGRL